MERTNTLTCRKHLSSLTLHLETHQWQAVQSILISKLLKIYGKLKFIGGNLTQAKALRPSRERLEWGKRWKRNTSHRDFWHHHLSNVLMGSFPVGLKPPSSLACTRASGSRLPAGWGA